MYMYIWRLTAKNNPNPPNPIEIGQIHVHVDITHMYGLCRLFRRVVVYNL
jgi:hypothetical protein